MTELYGSSVSDNVLPRRRLLFMGGDEVHWQKTLQAQTNGLKENYAFCCSENEDVFLAWDDLKKSRLVIADYELLNPFHVDLLPKLKLQMPFIPVLMCVEAFNVAHALQSFGASIDDCIVKVEGHVDFLAERVRWVCARMEREENKRRHMVEMFQNAQRMEAVGILAGGIAHEFNNVLSIVFGHLQLALFRLSDNDPVRDHLQQALFAGRRATDLVKDILNISRRQDGSPQKTQLSVIVKEAIKFLKASVPSNIEIRQDIQLQPQGWDTVLCHMTHIYQIFLNICTNALNAIGLDQYGTITIELRPYELIEERNPFTEKLKSGNYAALRIVDSGVGIAEEVRGRIFDPYFTTMTNDSSLGMGLTIVKELLESYGGAIFVESRQGEGTAITVLLRCEELAPVFKSSDDGRSIPMGKGRILLVDDEEMIVQVGLLMLSKLGYEVKGTTDSREALELFRSEPDSFDLVIMDLSMPKITGFDLAKSMLELRSDIPIVVCSGHSDATAITRLKEIGVSAFLRKPFIVKLLAETVKGALDQNRLKS